MIFRHGTVRSRGVNDGQRSTTMAARGRILRSTTVSGVQGRTTRALAKRWHGTRRESRPSILIPRTCLAESARILCARVAVESARPSKHHDIMMLPALHADDPRLALAQYIVAIP